MMEQGMLTIIIGLGVPILGAFVYACIWRRDVLVPLLVTLGFALLVVVWIALAAYIEWLVTR